MSKIKKYLRKIIILFKHKKYIPIVTNLECDKALAQRNILMVGGTGGIGNAIAHKLLNCGANVIITGSTKKSIEEARKKTHEKISYIELDLLKINTFENVINDVISRFGNIDTLILAAGVHSSNPNFYEMSSEEFDRVININLKANYFFARQFAKHLINNKIKGNILFVSSIRGIEPTLTPYGISKWGLNGFVKGLALELIKHGIVVNSIAPGPTATKLLEINSNSDTIYTNDNLSNRMVLPEEIAEIAYLLISNCGRMMVGNIVEVTGGYKYNKD